MPGKEQDDTLFSVIASRGRVLVFATLETYFMESTTPIGYFQMPGIKDLARYAEHLSGLSILVIVCKPCIQTTRD